MRGMWGVCALLAACLVNWPLRCAADCDVSIESKIKADNRDPMKFITVLDRELPGTYQILLMSSGQNIADKKGNSCLKMEITKDDTTQEHRLKYLDVENGNFKVTLKDGALLSTVTDNKGVVNLSHRLAYVSMEVLGLYACSDAAGDPALSVVAVAAWYASRPYLIDHKVKMAREALEKAGVRGFATVPHCPT